MEIGGVKTFFRNSRAYLLRLKRKKAVRKTLFWYLRLLPYVCTAVYAGFLIVAMTRHELWRDECQAWLLAKEAPTPWAVFHHIRYEGHPGLWHFLLWPIAHLWDNPAGMQAVHAILATGTAFVILRFSPFWFPIRMLLVSSYYFFFEYGVMSRNYGIGGLFLLLISIFWGDRWRKSLWIAVLAFLACHTHFLTLLLVIVMMGMLAVDFAVAYAGKFHQADRYFRRVMCAFLIMLAGVITGILQVSPPDDYSFCSRWNLTWSESYCNETMQAVPNALLPVVKDDRSFWNNNALIKRGKGEVEWYQIPFKETTKYACMILLVSMIFFIRRPWCGLQFLLMTAAIVLFTYVKITGFWRQNGIIFQAFVVCLWMSYSYEQWRLPWRIPDRITEYLLDKPRALLLIPLLFLHTRSSVIAWEYDRDYPFSNAKATAEWLKENHPQYREQKIVWVGGHEGSSLSAYLNKPVYFLRYNFEAGAIIWRNPEKGYKNPGHLAAADRFVKETGKPCLVVLQGQWRKAPDRVRLLNSFTEKTLYGEYYWVYEVSPAEKK